ncbi:MAG: hypothetical protein HQM08_25040 [Candidatus Riflebacteria bacterium]|nr:hypothetical protein [Candidatus Riflebacteria bacterium]
MLKRVLLVSVVAIFLATSCTTNAAEGRIKPENPKAIKIASQNDGSQTKFAPSGAIVQIMREFQEVRKKEAAISGIFRGIHKDLATTGNQPPASPEEANLPLVVVQLWDLEYILQGQFDKGYGDLDFWSRTYEMNQDEGWMAVAYLENLQTYPMNGLLRAALKNASDNLRNVCSREPSGGTQYWIDQSGIMRDALHQAGTNIRGVLDSVGNVPPAGAQEQMKVHLNLVRYFLAKQSDHGYGGLNYWIRSHEILRNEGRLAIGVLTRATDQLGANLQGLLRGNVQNVINNLNAAVNRYSNGYGDCNYWSAAFEDTRQGFWDAAKNIGEILNSI